MKFDRWTVLFLLHQDDAPELDEPESDALQDAHLAYLAALHADGRLLAAGPVRGPPGTPPVAGICIFGGEVDEARSLVEADPAVRAGLYRIDVVSWSVPGGTIAFLPSRFPRSMADAGAP
ncbi:MAG: YciI family protein [Thermoplasmata archaeon]